MSDRDFSARAAMQFRKGTHRSAWAAADVRRLRELAGQGVSPGAAAKLLRRSESAVRNKACLHGISFQRQGQFGFNRFSQGRRPKSADNPAVPATPLRLPRLHFGRKSLKVE